MIKVKKVFILYLLIGIVFFLSVFDNVIGLWSYVFKIANVNKDYLAVDTVWYNPENTYHNDTLINTLLSNKTCVCSSDSWYVEYYHIFSEKMDINCDIPGMLNSAEINKRNFEEVGYALAYIHSTLVDHEVFEVATQKDMPKLFVRIEGMSDTDRIVAVNDESGNIYLMAEDYWNEIYE